MSLREKRAKMDILGSIPDTYLRVVLKISLVLVVLNLISLGMMYFSTDSLGIALLTFVLSLIPAVGSFAILKIQAKRKNYDR